MSEPLDDRTIGMDGASEAPATLPADDGLHGVEPAQTVALEPGRRPDAPPEDATVAAEAVEATVAFGPDGRSDRTIAHGSSGRVITIDPASSVTSDFNANAPRTLDAESPTVTMTPSHKGKRSPAAQAQVPGFEILSELGRGGMGVVYKARQTALRRLVALKMVLAGAHASERQLARFQIEAHAVAALQHPGIVQIYEIGEHEGLPFFSLEFVPGGSLADKIDGKPQPVQAAALMIAELAAAMAVAHKAGIIHRDLKPPNILLTEDGQPKITDFGLAKQLDDDSGQTRTGAIMGTPSYMPPEQALGLTHEVGPLADQYALGAILYEMLTGRPPFQGASPLETLEQVRTREPLPPSQLQPKIPRDLETICLKCLQKDSQKRYADVAALAEDLDRFLGGQPILARPVSRPERAWRWCRRNPWVAGLAAAVALLMVVVTAGSTTAAFVFKNQKDQVARARDKAEKARKLAEKHEAEATKQEGIARENARKAIEQEKLAEEQRNRAILKEGQAMKIARGAFDNNKVMLNSIRLLSILANDRLRQLLGAEAIREELLGTAMRELEAGAGKIKDLGELASEYQLFEDQLAERTVLAAFQQKGLLYQELGRYDEAKKNFDELDRRAEHFAAANPLGDEPKKVVASVKCTLGDFYRQVVGDGAKAQAYYLRALELRQAWLDHDPTDPPKRAVANVLGALARTKLALGDLAGARGDFEREVQVRERLSAEALQDPNAQREQAGLYEQLGELSLRLRDLKAGRRNFDRALSIREGLGRRFPDDYKIQFDIMLARNRIGGVELLHLGDPAAAREAYEKGQAIVADLVAKDPESVPLRTALATSHYYLATALLRLGDRDGAATHYRASLEIRRPLAAVAEAGGEALKMPRIDLMVALARCGHHEEAARIAEDLIARPPADTRIYFQAACGFALCRGAARDSGTRADRYADRAFEALRAALDHGWSSAVDIETDPDLDPIREDPRFGTLLDDARRAERRRADASPRGPDEHGG